MWNWDRTRELGLSLKDFNVWKTNLMGNTFILKLNIILMIIQWKTKSIKWGITYACQCLDVLHNYLKHKSVQIFSKNFSNRKLLKKIILVTYRWKNNYSCDKVTGSLVHIERRKKKFIRVTRSWVVVYIERSVSLTILPTLETVQ